MQSKKVWPILYPQNKTYSVSKFIVCNSEQSKYSPRHLFLLIILRLLPVLQSYQLSQNCSYGFVVL